MIAYFHCAVRQLFADQLMKASSDTHCTSSVELGLKIRQHRDLRVPPLGLLEIIYAEDQTR